MQRDQNLLFGILAVQLRRVTPGQLVEAGAAWAVDPSEDLAERLVAIGALTSPDRALIDDFVKRAMADHGGDATKALQSFGGEQQVAESFQGSLIFSNGGLVSTAVGVAPGLQYQDLSTISAVQETPGRYTHVSEYGRGGMGRVLLVHDAFIGRRVALKELLPGLTGDGETPSTPSWRYMHVLSRFLQEARVTGQLEHPSIVPVYELGRRDDGTPYYTMKLVRGKTLRNALIEADGLAGRMALLPHVIDLCQAMAYAHIRRVIHRDIKPANVMVGEFGETVVLDWGIAKNLDADDAHAEELAETMHWLKAGDLDKAAETAYGAVMGTPAYMPPEQAKGEIERVGACSDIYALGVLLYEVLTGNTPFSGISVQEVLRKVREEEPRPVLTVEPRAPRDLAAIAMRAMAKEPGERYATAKELAEDLLRFQAGAMVDAYDYRASEYFWRFVAKHKAVLGTAAAALVVLLGFSIYSYANIMEARDLAERERHEALTAHAESERQRESAEAERERAEVMARQIEQAGYAPSVLRAQHRVRNNMLTGAREQLASTPEAMRHWEWGYLWDAMDASELTLASHSNSVLHAAFSPEGERLVTGSRDHTAIVWDARTGEQILGPLVHPGWVASVAFSPDGARILTAGWGNTAIVWDAETGEQVLGPLEHPGWVASASFSPDGTRILTAGWGRSAKVWDAETGERLIALEGHEDDLESIVFSPDGARILTAAWDDTARVWDAHSGEELLTLKGHTNVLLSATYSPGGARIVTGSHDRTARVWDAETGEELLKLEGHAGFIPSVSFSPDGGHILTSSWDRTAWLWDAVSGARVAALTGHGRTVRSAAFSPDGSRIVTASEDGTAKVWQVPGGADEGVFEGGWYADLSPDGALLVAWTDNDIASVWEVASGRKRFELDGLGNKIWAAAFDPDSARIVTASADGAARVFDAATGDELLRLHADSDALRTAAFSPCGTRIATGNEAGWLRVWDPAGESEELAVEAHGYRVRFVRFSPDGSTILTASSDNTAKLWDAATGASRHTLHGHDDEVRIAVFSPDGARIATASSDRTARIWDTATGTLLHSLEGHADRVLHAAFSPDGARLVTAAEDSAVKVWGVGSGDELLSLDDPAQWVGFVAFMPDGRSILACSGDGRAHRWHAAPWWANAWEESAHRAAITAHALHLAPSWERIAAPAEALAASSPPVERLRLETNLGLLVQPGEPLDLLPGLQLQPGDLVVRVNGRAPRATEELAEALAALAAQDSSDSGGTQLLRLQVVNGFAHRAYEVTAAPR